MSEQEQKDKLFEICKQFVQDQRIYCGESVYQTDRVAVNSLDLIFDICEVIGYNSASEENV